MYRLKHITYFFLLILLINKPIVCFSQKWILDLDSSFTDHSLLWQVKKKSIGPLTLIENHATRTGEAVEKKVYNDGIKKTSYNTKPYTAGKAFLYDNRDSIFVTLSYKNREEITGPTVFWDILSGKKNAGTYSDKTIYDDLSLQLMNDPEIWHFIPSYMDTTRRNMPGYFGRLVNALDTVSITYITGFKGYKKIYAGINTGILFTEKNKPLAAYQFVTAYQLFNPHNYAWIIKDAGIKKQMVIGAFIAVLNSLPPAE